MSKLRNSARAARFSNGSLHAKFGSVNVFWCNLWDIACINAPIWSVAQSRVLSCASGCIYSRGRKKAVAEGQSPA